RRDVYRPTDSREAWLEASARAGVDALVEEYGDLALAHFSRQVAALDPERREALRKLAELDPEPRAPAPPNPPRAPRRRAWPAGPRGAGGWRGLWSRRPGRLWRCPPRRTRLPSTCEPLRAASRPRCWSSRSWASPACSSGWRRAPRCGACARSGASCAR